MGKHSVWNVPVLVYITDPVQVCVGQPVRGNHCEGKLDFTAQRAPAAAKDNIKAVLDLHKKRESGSRYRMVKR